MTFAEKSVAIHDLMNASGVRFGTSGVRGLVSENQEPGKHPGA